MSKIAPRRSRASTSPTEITTVKPPLDGAIAPPKSGGASDRSWGESGQTNRIAVGWRLSLTTTFAGFYQRWNGR